MDSIIQHLRQKFQTERWALFREVSWNKPAGDLLQSHASMVDGLLEEIYQFSYETACRQAAPARNSGLTIVATGGYGRRELHPYSDIDIAFIPSEEDDPWVEAAVHTAFKLVMDVLLSLRDVRVGYSFRLASEASAWDLKTKTALLDLRYVCGSRKLAEELQSSIKKVLSPLDIMLECPQDGSGNNGQRYSLYSVEPNLKEGPGSLRDLHRARWIFKLLSNLDENGSEDGAWEYAGVPARQISEIKQATGWFWRSRTWLHLAAGRRNDTLIANYQDRIARELSGCSAQEWLAVHLAHSETLARFRQTAVRTLLKGPRGLTGARLEKGALDLDGDEVGSGVALFQASQRYGIPISLRAVERLQEFREESLKEASLSKEEIRAFNSILGERRSIAATLRSLIQNGLLDRFIPGYSDLMRFVPADPAHSHTVGEHSLRMIEHLELLRSGKDPAGERFTDLLGECSHFDMLCLASLIHDAGKIFPGRDHCESGGMLAKTVATRLQLAPEKSEILEILVRQHLLLVRTARLHDLKFPNVIKQVAESVPTLEALAHLYVLTYVDTRAVGEGNWTSMDGRDLEELYRKMREFYARSTGEETGDSAVEERIGLIRKKLSALHPSREDAAVQRHCDAMPSGYVLNTPLEEIAFHLQLLDQLDSDAVVLDLYNRPGDDHSELTVCAFDDPMPGMLAKIAGVLYGCGVDIHKAQAFTMQRARPVVLDTLWIRCNGMQISDNRARKIRATLKEVLTGIKTVDEVLGGAGKNLPTGTQVDDIRLRNDLSEEHTVVHIIARDSHGLLYLMTRSLSRCGLDIHSAKIATWNARAENNFYVTLAGGQIPESDLPQWASCLFEALQQAD